MLKDVTGRSEDQLHLPEDSQVAAVFQHYAVRFPEIQNFSKSIVMARNQEFSSLSAHLSDGDEVAFLPPVSGGSPLEITDESGHYFALTRIPIDTPGLSARLTHPSDGAVVVFEGVVRDNTKGRVTRFLDYECYEGMALKLMAAIGREIAAAHAIGRIGMVHRLGRMEIGEASVAIVATAPHRKPAFDAAFEGINRLKKTVPIWKKEYFTDGQVWVEGEWDDKAPVASAQ